MQFKFQIKFDISNNAEITRVNVEDADLNQGMNTFFEIIKNVPSPSKFTFKEYTFSNTDTHIENLYKIGRIMTIDNFIYQTFLIPMTSTENDLTEQQKESLQKVKLQRSKFLKEQNPEDPDARYRDIDSLYPHHMKDFETYNKTKSNNHFDTYTSVYVEDYLFNKMQRIKCDKTGCCIQ